MKDYRLQVRIKNNYLMSAIEGAGFERVSDFCRAFPALTPQEVGKALNLQQPLYSKDGGFRLVWIRLSDALRCLPEDLLPPQHAERALPTNVGVAELSLDEIETFLPGCLEPALLPDAAIEKQELDNALGDMIDTLNPREKRILERRFGLNDEEEATYREIGEEFGISVERTRQIEQKALRRLRHPRCVDKVRDLAGYGGFPKMKRVFVADDPEYVEERMKRMSQGDG